ncbi:hypothetical protein LCGC14_0107010 [marine sediment metagenome]|uniref:Uncharacterized protein n=1 Tax=marine sediment metagenome TaxID=412755 RepID=A0A0F9VAX4_9ZZZZ|nr:glycosyltransferase family 39 protein [Halomonas sp.]HDZ47799.1 hypothetical protein [Halomonas sp.]HEB26252.1 hypothetical protein [Porticoccus sp.]
MAADFYVFIIFVLAAVYCIGVSVLHRWLLWPLIAAYIIRSFLFALDYLNIFSPPGADTDALRFTRMAFEWSQLSWPDLLSLNVMFNSLFYSWLGAMIMKLVGTSHHILPVMSFLFGFVVVATTALIAKDLWGKRTATIVAFIIALYPFAAFNSILAMREEVAIMFFILGLYFFLKWVGGQSILGLLWGCLFFGTAVLFHPGWIGAFIGVAGYLAFFLYKVVFKTDTTKVSFHSTVKILLSSAMLVFSLGMIGFGGGVSLGKGIEVGGDEESGIGSAIESRFVRPATGGSAYPAFIAQGNPYTQPWLIPARIVYFHFSPFPWDIRSPRHLLGVVSSVLYMFLAWRVYKGWGTIKRREECLAMLFIFGALTFIFAIGVTNIGTATRHKTKLLGIFLLLAASSFHTLSIKLRRT